MDTEEPDREALLPPPEEAEGLLAHLAAVVRERGAGPLVRGVIVEPSPEHFPDAWTPTADGVESLARRLLGYAGLGDLEVLIETSEPLGEAPVGDGGGCTIGASDLPVWFEGIADGRCAIGIDEEQLEDAEVVAACLCHAVAHAYRIHHGVALELVADGTYREQPARREGRAALEERLTDVTAVFLGFGVIAANATHRQRTTGRMVGSYATWQMSTSRVGTLGPHAASYLLGAQAVARGLDERTKKRIAGHLETNQAAYFEAACAELGAGGVQALRDRLGVPDPSAWPAPPDLAELTAKPTKPAGARRRPAPREKRRENEGQPVFRVRDDWSSTCAVALGVLTAALLANVAGDNLWVIVVGVAFAVPIGQRIGRRIGAFDCASCETRLPAGVDTCPRCGGTVIGEIARRGDRLAALEAYEEEQKAGGALRDPEERG